MVASGECFVWSGFSKNVLPSKLKYQDMRIFFDIVKNFQILQILQNCMGVQGGPFRLSWW